MTPKKRTRLITEAYSLTRHAQGTLLDAGANEAPALYMPYLWRRYARRSLNTLRRAVSALEKALEEGR